MEAQTKVFVGSLPKGSKPEDLRKLFEGFGVVTECTVMNRCGFVHMQTEEQAAAAIRDLNNSTFNGGTITVEKGRIKEKKEVGPRGGGRGGPRGSMRGSVGHRGMRGGPLRGRGWRGPMRGVPMSRGMPLRNGRGYNRGMNRRPMRGPHNRFNPYGQIPDSRGFTLMEPPNVYYLSPTYSPSRQPSGSAPDSFNNKAPNMQNNKVTQPSSIAMSPSRAEPAVYTPPAAPGEFPYAQFPPVGPSGGSGAARH